MSLSSAKAKLDAQGGDPVTGYISKTDHQESYDELVDDTALTGATTAEAVTVSGALVAGTINGRDPDDLAKGAASSTDNALVRFDGTDGKTVQNSGITVDDSGNVTTDLTVSKATPVIKAGSTGTSTASFSAATTGVGFRDFGMYTGVLARWKFGANDSAESGSNVGSDFFLYRYNDAGSRITPNAMQVTRSTGMVNIGNVGATAGLELGSSGPRVMSGTGSPEGVVTAPVGSQWIDTAATTGAIKWIKATGTGNTGWVVESGDTGWRNLAAVSMSNSWAVAGSTFGLRRIGQSVSIRAAFSAASASADTLYTLPSGFRPIGNEQWYAPDAASAGRRCYIGSDGTITVVSYAATTYFVSATYSTTDAWPSSLPGT